MREKGEVREVGKVREVSQVKSSQVWQALFEIRSKDIVSEMLCQLM